MSSSGGGGGPVTTPQSIFDLDKRNKTHAAAPQAVMSAVEAAALEREASEAALRSPGCPSTKEWVMRPQHPLSLFEGIAGTSIWLADLAATIRREYPEHAFLESERPPRHMPVFPLYEVPFAAATRE